MMNTPLAGALALAFLVLLADAVFGPPMWRWLMNGIRRAAPYAVDVLAVVAIAAAIVGLFATAPVYGHEPMGRLGPLQYGAPEYTYLFKEGVDDTGERYSKNCCLAEAPTGQPQGDCKEYPLSKVKIVPGGFLLEDGEFIAQHDAAVSPRDPDGEYRVWRCRHPGALTHCFFYPPSGH